MDGSVPPVEFRSNCVSERAQGLGYFWEGAFLYNPEGHKIARYAMKLCSSDGTWASERYNDSRYDAPEYLSDSHPMVATAYELDDLKRRTEEWLIDNPNPPK